MGSLDDTCFVTQYYIEFLLFVSVIQSTSLFVSNMSYETFDTFLKRIKMFIGLKL